MLYFNSESGRSLLETLGVLAVLGLITLGGIKGFDMLTTKTASQNILDRVLDAAITRSHDFLSPAGRAYKASNRITFDNAPVPLSVENGTDGTLENLFWVTLGDNQTTVPQKTCAQLLQEKEKLQNAQLSLVDISINGAATSNCSESNMMRFFFKKNTKTSISSSSISVTPKITNDDGTTTDCPKITCPNHARCSGDTITCLAGYTKTGCNTCTPSCVPCSGETKQPNPTSDCTTECEPCGDGQFSANNHTICRDLNRGNPCPNGGYAGGSDAPGCHECLEDAHCPEGYICDENHTCQPASAGDSSHCSEGLIADGYGHCVVCRNNDDCPVCRSCAEGNMKCEIVSHNEDGHSPVSNLCDEDGNKVECFADYNGTTELGVCPSDKPKCNTSHKCEKCPNDKPVWDLTSSTCICPANATCSNKNGFISCSAGYYLSDNVCHPCPDGTFSQPGATRCTSCGNSKVSNENHTACVCPEGYTYVDVNHRCEPCEKGYYKDSIGNQACTKCPAGQYSALEGSKFCTNCPVGTYSAAGAGSCTNCTAGQYNDTEGATSCKTCPAGMYSDIDGASSCANCSKGTYNNTAGSTSCTNCPAGQYNNTEGSTSCSKCSKGTYNTSAGSTSCTKCPAGKYNNTEGSTSCANCPAGQFSNTDGSTSCAACGAGTTSSAGASSCTNCGAGTSGCGCSGNRPYANGSGGCVQCTSASHCTDALCGAWGEWLQGSRGISFDGYRDGNVACTNNRCTVWVCGGGVDHQGSNKCNYGPDTSWFSVSDCRSCYCTN